MKILWIGDAVVTTGFASCTHAACDALHAAGHEVSVLGINYDGDPNPPYPYPIYPPRSVVDGARDAFGVGRLPYLVDRINPDVVVVLNDSWNVPAYLDVLEAAYKDTGRTPPPIVAWLAVDGLNQIAAAQLDRCLAVATWTDFGARALRDSGCQKPIAIIPLGVDHTKFKPANREESRARVVPLPHHQDSFLIGAVGRNQLRKRLDLTIEAFAEFMHHVPGAKDRALLYLHCAPTGEDGAHLPALTRFYGLQSKILVARSILPGAGAPVDYMAAVYSALDVYLSTSQGEGWGLPALEAMACGVPCILPDWAAFGPRGWVGDAAVRVPCRTQLLTAPTGVASYTIGAVPSAVDVADELRAMFLSSKHRDTYAKRGLKKAWEFSWEQTGAAFVSFLERAWADRPQEAKVERWVVGNPDTRPEEMPREQPQSGVIPSG